jgi:hypothetical protein
MICRDIFATASRRFPAVIAYPFAKTLSVWQRVAFCGKVDPSRFPSIFFPQLESRHFLIHFSEMFWRVF